MSTLLTTFADSPLPNTLTPSSLPMRYSPVTASEYRKRSALGFAASAHMRTRMTCRARQFTGLAGSISGGPHLCRVPYHPRQAARHTRAGDGGGSGELGGAGLLLQLPGQDGVQAEAGGRVGRLPEDGGGQPGPEGEDSCAGARRQLAEGGFWQGVDSPSRMAKL